MIGTLASDRKYKNEWPIVAFWYTKHKGKTIEQIIDSDLTFFEWAVRSFQNVTPSQASYYKLKTGLTIPEECIQDVTPYQYQAGDPEEMYMKICQTQNLEECLKIYRHENNQLSIF